MDFIKKFLCKIGWHSPSSKYQLVKNDGFNGYANQYKCPWCGYIGMVDSQGNLF